MDDRGGKYSNTVRIGNWNEEIQLEELRMKDYLARKAKGALFVLTKQQRLENSLRRVPTEVDADGVLRLGNKIMLKNECSGCFLAGDTESQVLKEVGTCFTGTTSPNDVSCARSVYTLLPGSSNSYDRVIKYGQSIRLCAETLSSTPMYLQSESISELSYSKISRRQEVTLSPVANGETLWQILHADGKQRFATQGAPIQPGVFVLRHVGTGSYLSSDVSLEVRNLQGLEYEVHCHCYYSTNKTHNLYSERRGEITGDYALRRHGQQNLWTVIHN
jgi:hypothetical protein